ARVGGEPRWAAIALTGARAGLPLAGLVGLADLEHGDVGLLAPHVDRDGGEHALQRMAAEERRVLAQRVDQAERLGGAGRPEERRARRVAEGVRDRLREAGADECAAYGLGLAQARRELRGEGCAEHTSGLQSL